jgi:hypothetical protein
LASLDFIRRGKRSGKEEGNKWRAHGESGLVFESILSEVTEYDPDVLEPLIELAVEIRSRRTGGTARRLRTRSLQGLSFY